MSKVSVHLWSGLKHLTGGVDVVEVDAATVGQMFDAVIEQYPAVAPILNAGVSVAINGDVGVTSRFKKISPDDEIYLLQQMKGG